MAKVKQTSKNTIRIKKVAKATTHKNFRLEKDIKAAGADKVVTRTAEQNLKERDYWRKVNYLKGVKYNKLRKVLKRNKMPSKGKKNVLVYRTADALQHGAIQKCPSCGE